MTINAKDVSRFEKVKAQIRELHHEVSVLSKSKPDNPINKFKLGFINEKLDEANTILTGDFKPLKDFTIFDAGELPSNSDVVMVLSQYLDCLEAWRSAHVGHVPGSGHIWITNDRETIRTDPATRFRKT